MPEFENSEKSKCFNISIQLLTYTQTHRHTFILIYAK